MKDPFQPQIESVSVPESYNLGEDMEITYMVTTWDTPLVQQNLDSILASWGLVIGIVTEDGEIYMADCGNHPLLADVLNIKPVVLFQMDRDFMSPTGNTGKYNRIIINFENLGDLPNYLEGVLRFLCKPFTFNSQLKKLTDQKPHQLMLDINFLPLISWFTDVHIIIGGVRVLVAGIDSIDSSIIDLAMTHQPTLYDEHRLFWVFDPLSQIPRLGMGDTHNEAQLLLGYVNSGLIYLTYVPASRAHEPRIYVREMLRLNPQLAITYIKSLANALIEAGFPSLCELQFSIENPSTCGTMNYVYSLDHIQKTRPDLLLQHNRS